VDFKLKKYKHLDRDYHIQFWDIAGDERFADVSKLYIRGTSVCCIIIDVSSPESQVE
jgi:GTPase SAR1 family protein